MVVEKVPELVREGKRHRARERELERALETETHLRERETLAEWAREEQRERGVMSFVLRMDGRKRHAGSLEGEKTFGTSRMVPSHGMVPVITWYGTSDHMVWYQY